jgi:hypothetical protein
VITARCISECNNRTTGERAHPGDMIQIDHVEYERLLKAGCVLPMPEAAAMQPPQNASGMRPGTRRRKP